jgi:hypothetical protein
MNDNDRHKDLKRLAPHFYQGAAWVHWVMTIDKRRTGWLKGLMHGFIREALLHTLARYRLVCPVYCLMPDHAHFLWCGCASESDQRNASSFFRRIWNSDLREVGFALQKQPYDHVLFGRERDASPFEDTCVYIMENPERGGVVEEWRMWEFAGTILPGYPRIDPREERFWPKFWTGYNELRDPDTL